MSEFITKERAMDCVYEVATDAEMKDAKTLDLLYRVRSRIAKAGPGNPWVRAADKLPEEDGRYLCFGEESGCIFDAYYDSNIDDECPFGEWRQLFNHDTLGWDGEEWEPIEGVLWWMPLPPMPLDFNE